MTKLVISISGLQGSGKDTVASYLLQRFQGKRLVFAEPVKDVVAALFNYDRFKLEGLNKQDRRWRETSDVWWSKILKIPNFTPRKAMTYIGTDILRRYFCDKIHVYNLLSKLDNSEHQLYIITDTRHHIEFDALEHINHYLIHDEAVVIKVLVRKPDIPEWQESAIRYNNATSFFKNIYQFFWKYSRKANIINKNIHSSEYEHVSEQYEVIIENDGTLLDLYTKVDNQLVQDIESFLTLTNNLLSEGEQNELPTN